jgi:hypothetical protein
MTNDNRNKFSGTDQEDAGTEERLEGGGLVYEVGTSFIAYTLKGRRGG